MSSKFKAGCVPWNKGKKMPYTEARRKYDDRQRGVSKPKPVGFSETMRKVNPPHGRKKRYGDWGRDKKIRVWRDGYIMLYRPEHPSSRKVPPDYGYILEHRMVMEEVIGRKLFPTEVIHHIDGNKANNKPSNLILCKNNCVHNQIHTAMETFVEKLIREGKVYYDPFKKEFLFR